MRIVVFISNISRSSGGMSSAWDLAESLKQVGHEVSVLVNRKDIRNYYTQPSITSFPYSNIFLATSEINGRQSTKPNGTGLVAKSFQTLFRNRKRCHKALERADLIIDAVSLDSTQLNWLRQLNTKARVIRNHAGSPTKFKDHWLGHLSDLSSTEPWARYYEYCSRYNGLLFQSEQQEEEFWANLKEDLKIKTITIRPSCEEEKISKVINHNKEIYDSKFFNVAIVGSIQYVKGIDLALEVLRLVKDKKFLFHFVGSYYPNHTEHGKYYREILGLIDQFQLSDRVIFHGHRADYLDYMQDANLILQPSRQEGVSRILREAMFMKKPIMAFEISGTQTLLEDKKTAHLIKAYDVKAMAERLERWLEVPNDEKDRIVNNAFESYLKTNSRSIYLDMVAKKIPQFIES